jgi:hypothetical protein
MEKLSKGDKLDEADVAWARDRGITLPEEYGVEPGSVQVPPGEGLPVVQGGPALPPSPSAPGSSLQVNFDRMTKDSLLDFAEAAGIPANKSMTKAQIVDLIEGGPPPESEVEETLEEEE